MLARQPFLPSQSVQRLLRRYIRNSSRHRVLVGPPDPVSNLRPVIYDEGERGLGTGKDGESAPRSSPTHPYSLDEFDGDPTDYQWRIERKRLDAYNHVFWTEVRSFSLLQHLLFLFSLRTLYFYDTSSEFIFENILM